MSSLISISGIDQALSDLNCKPESLRSKCLSTIREMYASASNIDEVVAIPTEVLVAKIWQTDSPEEIRKKKKNLSSLKSGINKTLKELTLKGQNPEGIIITRDNVFSVSEDKKNEILKKLGVSSGDGPEFAEMFSAFKEAMPQMAGSDGAKKLRELFDNLTESQKMINGLQAELQEQNQTIGDLGKELSQTKENFEKAKKGEFDVTGTTESGDGEADAEGSGDDDIEIIKEDDNLVLDGQNLAGGDESSGDLDDDDNDIEFIEEDDSLVLDGKDLADGDEGPGDLDGDDDDIEIIEEDDDLVLDGQDLASGDEGPGDLDGDDDDIEIIEEDDDLVLDGQDLTDGDEGSGSLDGNDDDIEIIEEEEDLLLDEQDLTDGDEGSGGLDGNDDDIEIIEEDEDLVLDGQDLASGDEGPGDLDGNDDDIEIIEEEEDLLLDEQDLTDGDEGSGGLDGNDDDIEIIEEDEDFLLDEQDLTDGDEGSGGLDGNDDDIEIIEEEDDLLLDEQDLTDGDEGSGGLDGNDDDIEIIDEDDDLALNGQDLTNGDEAAGDLDGDDDDDDLEIIDEDDDLLELEDEDVEFVEDEDVVFVEDDAEKKPKKLLEVLSKYMDASEALNEKGSLKESEDGLVAQLIDRFTPKFIKIPEGEFYIGSNHPKGNERPIQKISLPSFYMGQHPVTTDLFDLFVRETGYQTDAENSGYGIVHQGACIAQTDPISAKKTITISRGHTSNKVKGANWRHPNGPESSLENKENHPVVQISHRDARAFASWAGKRLPSEDEWEAAARGRDDRLFPWGNLWSEKSANFSASYIGDTSPIGEQGLLTASQFHLCDLLGNVYEWTSSTITQPENTTKNTRQTTYILKGGCWLSSQIITISHRLIEHETWSNIIGFRCTV